MWVKQSLNRTDTFELDIVTARQKARRISRLLGFDNQDQARISTAVSELARNIYQYARTGSIDFIFALTPPQTLYIQAMDSGPGIRTRIYPPRPKIGIRASHPGQIWHLDVTILRLQDGSRAYVQAIIDNFSRYVLAWQVSQDYGGMRSKELIMRALRKAQEFGLSLTPNIFVDSGVENLNGNVDELVTSHLIQRTIAQIDIEFSNSMIEMLFHRLKHLYLFTIPLTDFAALVRGVDFYLTDSNTRIPHSVLKGATPEEVISGKWNGERMAEIQSAAKQLRMENNKKWRCLPCLT